MTDLPPLEEPQAYVVVGPDDQRGPYTLELLVGEVLAGRLSDATPVWWPGLADWTTMAGHRSLADEIQRRRSATSATAPGWSDPSATPSAPQPTYEQPTYDQTGYGQSSYDQPGQSQPSYGQQAAQPEPQQQPYQPQSYEQTPDEQPSYEQQSQQVVYDQAGAVAPAPEFAEPESFGDPGGTLIDVDSAGAVAWVSGSDAAPVQQVRGDGGAAFSDLVTRSAARAGETARVAAAEERFLGAVVDGAATHDFVVNGRDVVDGNTELRFDGTRDTHLVLTVGRFASLSAAEVSSAVVPLTVVVRTSSHGSLVDTPTGAHGEVVVVADEWSGQTSSTVSLVLGLEDYFGDDLALDHDAVVRDIGAAVAAVGDRLV